MDCEICMGTLNEVPRVVVKTGWMINANLCAHPCDECGTLHSKEGNILKNGNDEFARLTDNGTITLYSLQDVDLT